MVYNSQISSSGVVAKSPKAEEEYRAVKQRLRRRRRKKKKKKKDCFGLKCK